MNDCHFLKALHLQLLHYYQLVLLLPEQLVMPFSSWFTIIQIIQHAICYTYSDYRHTSYNSNYFKECFHFACFLPHISFIISIYQKQMHHLFFRCLLQFFHTYLYSPFTNNNSKYWLFFGSPALLRIVNLNFLFVSI